MNIRRGLFRAWTGLSFIWAVLIGVLFYEEGQKYFRPMRLTVANHEMEFPGTTSRATVKAALVTFFAQEKLKGANSKVPSHSDPEQVATEMSQKFAEKDFSEFALHISTLLFSVPAMFFALGALMLWVGAGFRPSLKSLGGRPTSAEGE